MEKKIKYRLCRINSDYCDFLRLYDTKVPLKDNRPYLAFAVVINNIDYALPITTQMLRQNGQRRNPRTTTEIKTGNSNYGAILHNNMIPIIDNVITIIDVKQESRIEQNKLFPKLSFIRKNLSDIVDKANDVYVKTVVDKDPFFIGFCCDFRTLETALEKYIQINNPK